MARNAINFATCLKRFGGKMSINSKDETESGSVEQETIEMINGALLHAKVKSIKIVPFTALGENDSSYGDIDYIDVEIERIQPQIGRWGVKPENMITLNYIEFVDTMPKVLVLTLTNDDNTEIRIHE